MLSLLEVSPILFLVSISVQGWTKKLPPKMWNESVIASYLLEILPWCHLHFVKNEMLECEIKVYLGYYSAFYRHHL